MTNRPIAMLGSDHEVPRRVIETPRRLHEPSIRVSARPGAQHDCQSGNSSRSPRDAVVAHHVRAVDPRF
jgi:hypothetical protein